MTMEAGIELSSLWQMQTLIHMQSNFWIKYSHYVHFVLISCPTVIITKPNFSSGPKPAVRNADSVAFYYCLKKTQIILYPLEFSERENYTPIHQ